MRISSRLALIKNFGGSATSKFSLVAFRFIQVPLLISFLGIEEYGKWLVFASLPTWLVLANLGFGSVASNEVTLAVASGDFKKARSVFSTTLLLITAILLVGCMLVSISVSFLPLAHFLRMPIDRQPELIVGAIFLALSVFIAFYGDVFGARFRAARKAHLPMLLGAMRPWIDLGFMTIALLVSKGFDYLAGALLLSSCLSASLSCVFGRFIFPRLTFSRDSIDLHNISFLFKKGCAMQAFPLGNALIFQGNILIIQAVLGPTSVALFATVRTLVRSVNQLMEMTNQIIWPELSHRLGEQNFLAAARLHRLGVFTSFSIACVAVVILLLIGRPLFTLWTDGALSLSLSLLLLFLAPIPFNALWYTSSVVHVASSQYEGLALRYVAACLFSVILCIPLTYFFNIYGAAVSTIFVDLALIPYVFHKSLSITHSRIDNTFSDLKADFQQCKKTFGALLQKNKF